MLETQGKGAGGEIQLTDTMVRIIGDKPFHGLTLNRKRFDCGDKVGYVTANLAVTIGRGGIGETVRAFAADFVQIDRDAIP